jgi:hypothetical protein
MMKFLKGERRKITFKDFITRRYLWLGHIIRHNVFVVNILEGVVSGKKGLGKTSTTILKASRQIHRS